MLRLGPDIQPEEVCKSLLPLKDGCAITLLQRDRKTATACSLEFGRDQYTIKYLDSFPGSYNFHVNLVSDPLGPIAKYEKVSQQERQLYERRIWRTHKKLNTIHASSSMKHFFYKLLSSTKGGDTAYTNPSVRAYLLCQISPTGLELWTGPGSATSNRKPFIFIYV
jgi:hypothetical protein